MRFTLLLSMLLIASGALAQDPPITGPGVPGEGGDAYEGGSVTNPFLGPDGACAAGNPTYSWTSSPTAGWYKQPDEAVTKNLFTFCLEAGTYGAAGKVMSFARADNGVGQTRTYIRFWDPDATTQVAGFFGATSSKWTTATTMGLKVFDTNDTAVGLASSNSESKVTIGDYNHLKDGHVDIIGGPTGADTFITFSPYNGVDFFQTFLNVVYPTATRTITLPDASGTVLLGGGTNTITLGSVAFAALGTPANGTMVYCSDCTRGSTPCLGASTGSMAKRENGAWYCD